MKKKIINSLELFGELQEICIIHAGGRVSHKDYQQQQTDNDKIAKITDIK